MAAGLKVRGDFGKLRKLVGNAEAFATGKNRARLSRQAAEAAMTELRLGFRGSRDPYGAPWAALAIRDGQPLRDTGRLANSFNVRVTATGFTIGTNVRYASVHQDGAVIVPKRAKALRFKVRGVRGYFTLKKATIPARKMLPEGSLGLWAEPIADALGETMIKLWKV